MKKSILLCMGILPLWLNAAPPSPEDLVVSFDTVVIPQEKLAFKKDWNVERPDLSEFEVEFCRFMSNELGQRFALVTFTNSKSGLRSIDERDVVGVLANGRRLYPIRLEGETQIGSRGSLLLHFGQHQFPLVGLETRTD
ncbi:hypothetical protein QEH56_04800 [Pelagicoccus enzymogenes]|uniref:hypothetical protein n=1 Tax=Pelagicoccus enzymogenes TaxID=2773457 RepID=UPI00280EDC87|nr:hypothetical protein [Pelagicoccus enzymogenes]MDQ8197453.1 hypothetical protein [Pelagicoccus enzymogenes]